MFYYICFDENGFDVATMETSSPLEPEVNPNWKACTKEEYDSYDL